MFTVGTAVTRTMTTPDGQAEADRIENLAARRAYDIGFGASEWEAFLEPDEVKRLIDLGDQGFGTWGSEAETLARIKQIRARDVVACEAGQCEPCCPDCGAVDCGRAASSAYDCTSEFLPGRGKICPRCHQLDCDSVSTDSDSDTQAQAGLGSSRGYAFLDSDGTIDLDSVAETEAEVRRKVLEESMGWRFEHPDRYSHEDEWERMLQYGKVVPVYVSEEKITTEENAKSTAPPHAAADRVFACGSYGVLTREQAAVIAEGHTFMHNQFKAVSFYSCRQILDDRFDLLIADPVRGRGPTAGTIYPWNVVDYMIHENPRVGSKAKATAAR